MVELSSADHRTSPARITLPKRYNAAHDLIARNLEAGRGPKRAYIDDDRNYSYAELAERIERCANVLVGLGLQPEQRVMLCLTDTIDFPTAFLGSILSGIVPVAISTFLQAEDYALPINDCRARALIVSANVLPVLQPILHRVETLKHIIVSRGESPTFPNLDSLLESACTSFDAYPSNPDSPCFWLYSSGSTGTPKGTHPRTRKSHSDGGALRAADSGADR